jgi:hypothetical protein
MVYTPNTRSNFYRRRGKPVKVLEEVVMPYNTGKSYVIVAIMD